MSNMNWIDVNDRLPEIPEGKHGVAVIVAAYDSVYAEINGNGYSVHDAHYGFKGDDDIDFKTLYYRQNSEEWGASC